MSNEKTNAVVASEQATNENVNAQPAVASVQPEGIDATIARLCKDGKSHVVTTQITAIDCTERTAKNGNKYINAFINITTPLKGAQKMSDGTTRMGLIGAFQTPFNSILLVMRKDVFYGRFVASLEEAAEVNMVGDYLAGVGIRIFCQFIAAGEVGHNPFTRSATEYDVQDYDRYVYHIVGIDAPTDPITIAEFTELRKQQQAARLDAIKAKRAAKAAVANVLSAAVATDDMPF